MRQLRARPAVVRGFVTDPARPIEPPAGAVSVDGSLAPGEAPAAAPTGLPAWPQQARGSIDFSLLVNQWPGELYNAFVFAQTERRLPAHDTVALPGGLDRVPTPSGETGFKWRNAAYALQWWAFAAFALYMWWRIVRDEGRQEAAGRAAADQVDASGDNGRRE